MNSVGEVILTSVIASDASVDRDLADMQERLALPMDGTQTRFCMLPFQRTFIFENGVSLCCAQSLKAYPLPIARFVDGSVEEVWCGQFMGEIRKALLKGDQNNMPVACLKCERAPAVSPSSLRLHLALHLNISNPSKSNLNILNQAIAGYDDYRAELERINVRPFPKPIDVSNVAVERASVLKSALTEFFSEGDRIVLWGAGAWGRYWLAILVEMGHQVVAFVDANDFGPRSIGGVSVMSQAELSKVLFDRVVICSIAFFDEIFQILKRRGLEDRVVDLRPWMGDMQ